MDSDGKEDSVESLKEDILKGTQKSNLYFNKFVLRIPLRAALQVEFKLKSYSNDDFEGCKRIGYSCGGRANLTWMKLKSEEVR